MQTKPQDVSEKVTHDLNEQDLKTSPFTLKEQIRDIAFNGLISSQQYKQPRMNTMAVYERLYNNDILPKLRQMFNSVLPIFSGMVDELLAMFNDQVQLKFSAINPAQQLVVPKIQAHWNAERDSMTPNAMWDYKARTDRFNAVISGRGIFKEYVFNDPTYTNVLEVINYSDFHCQPMGGGLLDNHLFKGTEGNYRTKFELMASSKYDQEQVKKLVEYAWSDAMMQNLDSTYGTKFSRWKALGLNPEGNSFVGEPTYNLCDFIVRHNGIDYNVVFESCTKIWLYIEPWKDTMPSGNSPYKSYATHEDDKNFWSKSYADDFFTIADAVITLFNQELTNREKKNFNARAFDKDMFKDVAKLDAAQYRPDALVPADTMGGTKQIASGLYAFDTPQLQGTINLIDWMSNYTGQKTGADELPPGSAKNKAKIVELQVNKQSKRIGLRADSFQECYQQLGEIYLEGLREFMPPTLSIQVVGENGFIEEQELKKIEVAKAGKIGISVTSGSEQESSDQMKKDGQIKAIELVAQNPNFTRYEKETVYRNVGQFDENEIIFLLDTKGALSRKQFANASAAIQDILLGKKPDVYYGADGAYLKYLKQYLVDNKGKVRGKEKDFSAFLDAIGPIVDANMKEQAKNEPQPPQDGADQKPDPNAKPQPRPPIPPVTIPQQQ